jgi:hypothetical protein
MNQQELEIIARDTTGLYTQIQKDKATQALSKVQNQPAEGFDPSAEMWADLARTDRDPVRRAHKFSQLRETYKNNPEALKSLSHERETMRAKRAVYDSDGGDIIGYAYDEDVPALIAEKGKGYYKTVAYYVEMRGLTPDAAEKQVKKDELIKKALALREQNGRTIDPSMSVDQLTAAIADRKTTQAEEMRLWKEKL